MEPRSLVELVSGGIRRDPSSIRFATKRDGQWIHTRGEEFLQQVRAISAGLRKLGVGRGDAVVVHAENSTEWLMVDHAVHRLGAVVVPIYVTQHTDQIRFIVEDAGARVYFLSRQSLYDRVAPALAHVRPLQHLVSMVDAQGDTIQPWTDFLASGRRALAEHPDAEAEDLPDVGPGDLASIVYTSGTTGRPKGVLLTHGNLVSNVMASVERVPFEVPGNLERRVLSYLPLSHVFERMMTYLHIELDCSIYFVERHEELLEDLREIRPVHFASVPRLLEKVVAGVKLHADQAAGARGALLRWAIHQAEQFDVERGGASLHHRVADALVFGKLRKQFGGRLQGITCGGAALSAPVMNFVNAMGIFCGQGYGMTETSPVVSVYRIGRLRAGSVGTVLRGVALRVAEDGELLVRGPNVMKGYHNLPDQTREVFTEDGWLRTGDIGHVDEQGFVFITDRKKELLKLSTGKYVAPQPIESALSSNRYIEQAMVVGNAQPFCAALLVPDPRALHAHGYQAGATNLTPPYQESENVRARMKEAVAGVNRDLPPWEQIKRFRILDAPFSIEKGELTPTLKLKRREILAQRRAEVEALFARP